MPPENISDNLAATETHSNLQASIDAATLSVAFPKHVVDIHIRPDHPHVLVSLESLRNAVCNHPDDSVPLLVRPCGGPCHYLALAATLFAHLVSWGRPQLNLVIARPSLSEVKTTPDIAVNRANHSTGSGANVLIVIPPADPAATLPNSTPKPVSDTFGTVPTAPPAPDPFAAYPVVAVGGTFDRLHAGHRLLLSAAAWAARDVVRIGLAAPNLLAHKAGAERIASLTDRTAAAIQYVALARLVAGLAADPATAIAGARPSLLVDANGPAATAPYLHGLVVSVETARGAKRVNDARHARGLERLEVIVVPVLDASAGQKLSSSGLRKAETEAHAQTETATSFTTAAKLQSET